MALEGGFLRRILRGPDAGSGSGGDHALEDREAAQKKSLRNKIDNLLSDESVAGQIRTAYEELKAALDGNSIKESFDLVRSLLGAEDRDTFDSLGTEYHIARDPESEPVSADAPMTAVEVATEVAPPEAPVAEASRPISSERDQRLQARVDDILRRAKTNPNNARKQLRKLKLLDEDRAEIERRLTTAGFSVESPKRDAGQEAVVANRPAAPDSVVTPTMPKEAAATSLEQPVQKAVADSIPLIDEPVAPTLAEPPAAEDEAVDVSELEQELARALGKPDAVASDVRAAAEVSPEPAPDVAPGADEAVAAEEESQPFQISDWKSRDEIERDLGTPTNDLRGFPVWDLSDNSAVIMRKGDPYALQIRKDGIIKIPGRSYRNESAAWFQYDGANFNEITEAQHEAIIEDMRRAEEVAERARRQQNRQERARAARSADPRETTEARVTPDSQHQEPVLSPERAYQRFIQMRARSRQPAIATAFQESARDLRPEDRRPLWDRLVREEYISPNTPEGIREGILNRLAYEDQQGGRKRETVAPAAPNPAETRRTASPEAFMTSDEAVAEFQDRLSRNQRLSTAYREATRRVSLLALNRAIDKLRKIEGIDQTELERVIARDSRLAAAATASAEAPRTVEEPVSVPPTTEARESREARERRELREQIQREADAIFGPDK